MKKDRRQIKIKFDENGTMKVEDSAAPQKKEAGMSFEEAAEHLRELSRSLNTSSKSTEDEDCCECLGRPYSCTDADCMGSGTKTAKESGFKEVLNLREIPTIEVPIVNADFIDEMFKSGFSEARAVEEAQKYIKEQYAKLNKEKEAGREERSKKSRKQANEFLISAIVEYYYAIFDKYMPIEDVQDLDKALSELVEEVWPSVTSLAKLQDSGFFKSMSAEEIGAYIKDALNLYSFTNGVKQK